MPSADVRANSLFIPRDGDQPATALAKVDLPTMILNKIERTSIVKLEGNDVTFSRNITRWGATASAMRSDYVDLGQEEREKTLTQNVSSGYKSQLKLNYLKFGDLKKLQDTLKMEYSFTLKKEVNEIAGMKVFRIPWADAVETLDFVALEKRTYPFDVWEYTSLKSNIYLLLLCIGLVLFLFNGHIFLGNMLVSRRCTARWWKFGETWLPCSQELFI